MTAVLNASAVLALLLREKGATEVEEVLADSLISAVNWSEVVQELAVRGVPEPAALFVLGLRVEPFTLTDARTAAALWAQARTLGLSPADRACLALAARCDSEAWTADRVWATGDLGSRATQRGRSGRDHLALRTSVLTARPPPPRRMQRGSAPPPPPRSTR